MGKPFAKPSCPVVIPPPTPSPPMADATKETPVAKPSAPTGFVVTSGGKYFYADDTIFHGLSYPWWGGPVYGEQCRNGEMIWSGNIKIWQGTNGFKGECPE